MYISTKDWNNFIGALSKLNQASADAIVKYVNKYGFGDTDALVGYAKGVVDLYGNASASLAAQMYDEIAELEGKFYEPAELADTPDYGEVAKTVYGVLKTSDNPNEMGGAVSRLVKRTGQDTLLQNGIRDGAEFAWIPNGDTCAFCLTLASRGWQKISKKALKNGHAEHIHSNCNCSYMIRHSDDVDVVGYEPEKYYEMYQNAEGKTPNEKINYIRRMQNAERNKPKTNKRYSVTQKQIDDIIKEDLKDFEIIKHPEYNARLRAQGKTTAELYPWGEVKAIKKIEIGPQSKDTKECLIDSIIHEELEAKIMIESGKDEFYKKLHELNDDDRHSYINNTIKDYFEKKGWNYGLV